jgi:hypothetical protein
MNKIKLGRLLGLCQGCCRYHPRGVAHCLLAKDAGRLARKWKYNLMVTDCELFLPPAEAFPLMEGEVVEDGVLVEKEKNGSEVMVGAVLKKEKKKK